MVGVGVTSLSKLEAAIRDFHRDHEPSDDDPKRLRAVIDALELEFSSMARRWLLRGGTPLRRGLTSRSCSPPISRIPSPPPTPPLDGRAQLETRPRRPSALARDR